MRRCFCLLPLMLLETIRLRAEAPARAVEVPVWSVTGFSGILTRGMRVDMLFFEAGPDGAPLSKRLLLALRNVEVFWSQASPHTGGGRYPQLTTLLLAESQTEAMRGLPPAAVELLVIGPHKDSSKLAESRAGPPQRQRGSHSSGGAYQTGSVDNAEREDPDPVFSSRSGPTTLLGRIGQYLLWPVLCFLVFQCCLGMLRGRRRWQQVGEKSHRRFGPAPFGGNGTR